MVRCSFCYLPVSLKSLSIRDPDNGEIFRYCKQCEEDFWDLIERELNQEKTSRRIHLKKWDLD